MTPDGRQAGVRLIVSIYREFEQSSRRSDLSIAQYRTLLYLFDGPLRAGELAAANAVTKPTVSAMIASLRENGWIDEAVDPTDGRATRVVLTDAGRERVALFESALADRLEDLLDAVPPEQIRTTMSELYEIVAASREERLANVFGSPRSA